ENLVYFHPCTQLIARRKDFRAASDNFLDAPLRPTRRSKRPAPQTVQSVIRTSIKERVQCLYQHEPHVAVVWPNEDNHRITSAVLYRGGGSFYRVELIPEYFRAKQMEMTARIIALPPLGFTGHPVYWRTFQEILHLARHHGIRLIVNEMEESP